ncbi:MAG: leader peptidase (prepilin peptidase)/N-methyltransferase [Candidatus Krumholzibacteriia bacterium]|jgi:leader peptidase (prepilin peptidase)/N-methyltransferase
MPTFLTGNLMLDQSILWGLVAWLGACVGSFSNVLIYRLPRNKDVVRGRSHCPSCAKMVAWYDNIPVVSWLLLRGRCRHCDAGISVRYLLVELAGAACAVVGIWRFGWNLEGLSASFFLIVLLDIALIDWEHMIIPHTLTLSGAALGLAFSFFITPQLPQALLGAAAGAGVILAVSYGYKVFRGVIGMGGGDVMLMGMIGIFVGPWGAMAVLFSGALFGAVYALIAGRGSVQGAAKLPFGTFLAAAAGIVLLFGADLWSLYLSIY